MTTPINHSELVTLGARRLMQLASAAGGELRIVGGAVRDHLLGRPLGDIDLASTLPPEHLIDVLKAANVKVVPTGLQHGTVTAVIDGVGYEVTTLRRDIETDGRHAVVEYTNDWQADAARRDFTMNAMYVDAAGTLYDYFGGQNDAASGHVRFIGDPVTRITEDALRILRFFRFYAVFGQGPADVDAFSACDLHAPMMRNLSVERVWREIVKLLAASNPLPSWRLIMQGGILQDIFPETVDTERLARLMDTERKMDAAADALVRLAALLVSDTDAAALAARLKLSNRETETLTSYVKLLPEMRGITDPVPLHRAMYQHGASACRAALLVVGSELPARDIGALYDEASTWEVPTFNLQGQDIVKLGIPQGPRVGEILKAVEEWWAGDDFHATRNECLAEAKRLITVSDR